MLYVQWRMARQGTRGVWRLNVKNARVCENKLEWRRNEMILARRDDLYSRGSSVTTSAVVRLDPCLQ